jgi:hypothetical protein
MLLTVVADETIGEAFGVEVDDASFLVGEVLLEVGQRLGDTTVSAAFRHR